MYDIIKVLVRRPGPAVAQLLPSTAGFSFPSGHATQTTAVVGALAYLASTGMPRWASKVAAWATAAIIVLLVGCSRVYLGTQWTSDVIAGSALGALWLAALLTTIKLSTELHGDRSPPAESPPGRRAAVTHASPQHLRSGR